MGLQANFAFPEERKIWTVSALLARLRQTVEQGFFDVWIEGEISNFHQAPSRHCYFTLKDGQGQIKAALFAAAARYVPFRLRDGLQVLVRGRISIYETRGELQCCVEHVEPLGRGALQLAFEQLKHKLAEEGLFDAARKRPLPVLPRRLGVITSPRGAAVADILRTLQRRFPGMDVLLYPVLVQGAAAGGEIRAALAFFARQTPASRFWADVVIVARGGGSIEDLWPFNEEAVARAIAAMPMPVISGVGHETDFTISDFVADARAPTPTGAAELAVRPREEFLRQLAAAARHLQQAERLRRLELTRRLEELAQRRAFRSVERRLQAYGQRVDESSVQLRGAAERHLEARRHRLALASTRVRHHDARARLQLIGAGMRARERALHNAVHALLVQHRHRVDACAALLEERNPLRLLERGYALVYDAGGSVVLNPQAVAEGDRLRIRLAGGWLGAEARGAERKPGENGRE